MRLILLCLTLVVACSGLVQAAGDEGLFVPSIDDTSTSHQDNRWKSERTSSHRPTAVKRSSTAADRNDEASAASADGSILPWAIALFAVGGLTVTSVSAFFAIRAWRARTAGHHSRNRSAASAFLAASLVQTQMCNGEMPNTANQDEEKTRRAA